MLSILRSGLVYKDISSDIVEHDLDIDADQWNYDNKDVYRGSVDPEYVSYGLNVYWLYDDNLMRVGLAEHEAKEPEVFKTLWFRSNPFATLYQDDSWESTGSTLWSKLSNEAYQDFLEGMNVHDKAINSGVLLATPSMIIEKPKLYTCEKCNKKSLAKERSCSQALCSDLDFSQFSILFLDEDYILYKKSVKPQADDASSEEQTEQNSQPVDSQESPDVQTLLADLSPPVEEQEQEHQQPQS